MKTRHDKRVGMAVAALLVFSVATPALADLSFDIGAKIQIGTRPQENLRVWVWPDRGEGAGYLPGDEIAMYVEANRDCYLILYNIDTRGRLNILFPYDPWDDNFIPGGEVVRFPHPSARVDWTVEGPPGVEYVQAIASVHPIRPPDWPVYLRSVNGRDGVSFDRALNDFWAYDDRLAYIEVVNRKITGRHWNWCATDLATFHVRPRNYWIDLYPWDPWPEVYYGEIYIGWPVGGAIHVDGVFIGYAPLHVPRSRWGRHRITCYVGGRLVQHHNVQLYPKKKYRYRRPAYGSRDVFANGHVKIGKRGRPHGYDSNPRWRQKVKRARHDNVQRYEIVKRSRHSRIAVTPPKVGARARVDVKAVKRRDQRVRTTAVTTRRAESVTKVRGSVSRRESQRMAGRTTLKLRSGPSHGSFGHAHGAVARVAAERSVRNAQGSGGIKVEAKATKAGSTRAGRSPAGGGRAKTVKTR